MEDPLIENNNGLNDMSADDGGSSHDETEDEGSVGTNAFITPLAQYTPYDGHLGLRRRRRTNVSYSEDDHQHQETHLRLVDGIYDIVKSKPVAKLFYEPHDGHFGLLLGRIKVLLRGFDYYHHYFWNRLIELAEGEKEVYQMIYPPAMIDLWNRLIELGEGENEVYQMINHPAFMAKWNRLIKLGGEDEVYQMIYPSAVIAAAGTEVPSEDDSINSSLDLAAGVDIDSQMISPRRTVIGAAGTDCILNLGTASFVTARPRHTEMDFGWIFVITNIVLESMSAIFTQLSSKQKPQYALLGMLLSYLALLTCIIELIYEGRRRRHQQIPIGRTRSGTWYYSDPPLRRKSCATLNSNIAALACALGECVVTTINYRFDSPIKLNVWPIILVYGMLFSKILKYRERESTLISLMKSQ